MHFTAGPWIEWYKMSYWGPARHFLETREVTEDETRQIDALAEALDPAPATREKCDSRFKSLPLGASDRDSFQRDRDHS